jgi:filamentous hemagglutinin
LSNTTVGFFGPAFNANDADVLLGYLQNRNAANNPKELALMLQNHIADPVGGIIGGNSATGGSIPDGSNRLIQALRAAMGKENTSHNCYGDAPSACSSFWIGSPNKKPISEPVDNKNGAN